MPALEELEAAWIEARRDPGYARGAQRPAGRLRRAPDAALPRRAHERGRGPRDLAQARGPRCTPARTSSTTRSARRCSPSAWARRGSSPRPAPASTASAPRRRARCSAWSASSTWAPRTCAASAPTSSACELLGTEVRPVEAGTRTLKEATSEAIRDWVTNVGTTHYVIGSAIGPAPVPVDRPRPSARHRRRGARPAARARGTPARIASSPASAAARTRSGSSRAFAGDDERRAARRRGGGRGPGDRPPRRAADRRRAARRAARRADRAAADRRGPGHRGALDLRRASTTPARGPELAWLRDKGRASFVAVTDEQALAGAARRRPARGHHPRARDRARAAHRAARAFGLSARPRLLLGPRRQGPRRGDGRRLPAEDGGNA